MPEISLLPKLIMENTIIPEAVLEETTLPYVFEVYTDIPEDMVNSMLGKSLPNVEFAITLSLVTVTYIDYNGDTKTGDMVVHKDLAEEVAEIFEEIYLAKFPIANIELIDKYDADDNLSMINNNTSAFNYRLISGTNIISNHSYGRCIDINPLVNPHVINGVAYPKEGSAYIDRSLDYTGMIKEGDVVYNAFISRGWSWGGHWNSPDYQHFEK
ncbi:MAG: hypothetical protein BEN19_05095 [Epulopiscium sp. Nuni2H_MBin003]|nr:MAG: hypothetical protein BEN19_05095 [Epulopiscium sp. Nuni2H_MBin003]